APYRNKKRRGSLSINWPAWKETGMAVDYHVNQDGMFQALSTAKALQGFEIIFKSGVNQAVIEISSQAELALKQTPLKEKTAEKYKAVKLTGKINRNYSLAEQSIADMWGRFLGTTIINVFDSFNAIGGNSILAIKLLNEIDVVYPDMVEIADIFTYNTINKLAEVITARENAADADHKLLEMLSSLEKGDISVEDGLLNLERGS
ncbi:phosphopantetheine-binding protein, partial [Lacrimispora brassicae]